MNLVPLSDLYTAIAASAPGLNEISAIDELRRAARVLARESMASAESMPTSVTVGGQYVAVDEADSQVEPVGVLWVQYGSRRLHPITLNDLTIKNPGWRALPRGAPMEFVLETIDELTLIPTPDKDEATVILRVAYQPKRDADSIDEVLVRHYEEGIIDGALSRILGMPNTTWHNPTEAAMAKDRFETAVSRARQDGVRNHTVNVPLTRFVRPAA